MATSPGSSASVGVGPPWSEGRSSNVVVETSATLAWHSPTASTRPMTMSPTVLPLAKAQSLGLEFARPATTIEVRRTTLPLVVERSTFEENEVVADNQAGGGGIAAMSGGTVTVTNATFWLNAARSAFGARGGAIWNETSPTSELFTTIVASTFAHNYAVSSGAAM